MWVVPGLIDAHVHIESSRLLPDEFARLVLPHGTTTVVADPHEIANVLGTDGVHWLLDSTERLPLDVFFMASSCVPASAFESPRRPLTPGDLEGLLRRRRVIGLAEMMNFPGVIAGSASELEKLGLAGAEHVDGHAPGVLGHSLQAYAAAGIRSDHEATTLAEGRERLRAGMWVLIREASGARNLAALLPLVAEFGPGRLAFCTDDRDPDHIVSEGHINSMVRAAVAAGVAPADALVMASHHPATWHGLGDRGALAPGYRADVLLLPDLETFRPATVLKDGRPVEDLPAADVPDWVRNTVHVAPLTSGDLRIPWEGGDARVIGVRSGQIVTDSLVMPPRVADGAAFADPERGLAKIAVIERHLGTGRIGLGFIHGLGLRRGAIASTVAHDAHNVVVAGADDDDMVRAARRLGEIGGGMVAVHDRGIKAELALPVAGLMSDAPAEEVVAASRALAEAAAALGCTLEAPFHSLGFLALSVIPELKITDHGLIDVESFSIVSLRAS
jgi:adenine deaminase